jgi:hypothetical protein
MHSFEKRLAAPRPGVLGLIPQQSEWVATGILENLARPFTRFRFNRPFWLWCLLPCLLAQAVAGQSTAGPLASLYAGFLSSGNSNVFVALEQERVFPESRTGSTQIELGNGRTAQIDYHNKTYLGFGRNGAHFIIGTSSRKPVLERENLMAADTLQGFDGSNYWTFRLGNSIQIFRHMEGSAESALVKSLNQLTIIPLEEASREQGIYQADVTLEAIRTLLLECVNVVQFGYGGELAAPPAAEDQRLLFRGPNVKGNEARVTGDLTLPDSLVYHSPGTSLAVELDYRENSLTLTRRHGKPSSIIRYRILAVEEFPAPVSREVFSWNYYKDQDRAGEVLTTLLKDGATAMAELTEEGQVAAGKIIGAAVPTEKKGLMIRRRQMYGILALLALGAILALFGSRVLKGRSAINNN